MSFPLVFFSLFIFSSCLPRDIAAADKRIFIYKYLGKGPAVSGEMKDMEAKDKIKDKAKDKGKD